jgi:TPR repeat protein
LLLALAVVARHDGAHHRERTNSTTGKNSLSAMALAALAMVSPIAMAQEDQCLSAGERYLVPAMDPVALQRDIKAIRSELKSKAIPAEKARDALALISMYALLAADRHDSLGQALEAKALRDLVERELKDTMWRIERWQQTGHRSASVALSEFYRLGIAAPADGARACQLRTSIARPIPDDDYRLALCTKQADPKAALALMQRAAEQGHPAAAETLGLLCMNAKPANLGCAKQWLCKAGELGRIRSTALWAFLLTEQAPSLEQFRQAEVLYRKAAEAGDATSQNNLAELYEMGHLGEVDIGRAELWYARAAAAGDPRAKLNLARVLILQLKEKPWKTTEAKRWLLLAAKALPDDAKALARAHHLPWL